MKRVMLLGVAIVVLAVVAGYLLFVPDARDAFAAKKAISDRAAIDKIALGFVQNPYPDDYNTMRIPGWIDNHSKGRIVRADLEIQLVDKDGNRKELVRYQVRDIAAGTRKSFDANGGAFTSPRNAEAKIVKLEVAQ